MLKQKPQKEDKKLHKGIKPFTSSKVVPPGTSSKKDQYLQTLCTSI